MGKAREGGAEMGDLQLVPLAKIIAYVDSVTTTGRMDAGVRQLYVVKGGTVSGELVQGKILPGGGDNMLVDPGGLGHVDARLTWQTDDGAIIYVQYLGRVVMTEEVGKAFRESTGTQFGDTYFVTQPRFECGDPRYAWLNGKVGVAMGRVAEGRGIEYQVYYCEMPGANDEH